MFSTKNQPLVAMMLVFLGSVAAVIGFYVMNKALILMAIMAVCVGGMVLAHHASQKNPDEDEKFFKAPGLQEAPARFEAPRSYTTTTAPPGTPLYRSASYVFGAALLGIAGYGAFYSFALQQDLAQLRGQVRALEHELIAGEQEVYPHVGSDVGKKAILGDITNLREQVAALLSEQELRINRSVQELEAVIQRADLSDPTRQEVDEVLRVLKGDVP